MEHICIRYWVMSSFYHHNSTMKLVPFSSPINKSSGISVPSVLLPRCPWHETSTSWSEKTAQALAIMSAFKPAEGGGAKNMPFPFQDLPESSSGHISLYTIVQVQHMAAPGCEISLNSGQLCDC